MDVRAITVEVSKLSLKPGDVLAIRCDRILTSDQMAQMQQAFELIAPDGVKFAVFDAGCTLSIVEPPNSDCTDPRRLSSGTE